MYTTVDKAIVAVLGGIIALIDMLFGINIGIGENVVAAIAAVITPLLVYLVPNKAKPTA